MIRLSLVLVCMTALAAPLRAQAVETPEARLAALGLTLPVDVGAEDMPEELTSVSTP